MKATIKTKMMAGSAAMFIGLVSGVESAFAGNNFNKIVDNMESSISGIPGLISGVSYMMGILLGVLGILKIKDHVENPGSAKLQEGAVRLAAGGGLFALPIVYEAMRNTIGQDGTLVEAPKVKALKLDVQ
ncbi:MAG: hypothetical protein WC989_07000 [Micavibrio sp.]